MTSISLVQGPGAHAARLAARLANHGPRVRIAADATGVRDLLSAPTDVLVISGGTVDTGGDWHVGTKSAPLISLSDLTTIPASFVVIDSVDVTRVASDVAARLAGPGALFCPPSNARQKWVDEDSEQFISDFIVGIYDREDPQLATLVNVWMEAEKDLLDASRSYLQRRRQPVMFRRIAKA